MNPEDVASLFGTTQGFKADEPNVTPAATVEDDDFYGFPFWSRRTGC